MRTCKFSLGFLLVCALTAAGEESVPREGKQLNDQEQKYDFELSFPVDSDEATNADGRVERIESLLQSLLLENENLVRSLNLNKNLFNFFFLYNSNLSNVVL